MHGPRVLGDRSATVSRDARGTIARPLRREAIRQVGLHARRTDALTERVGIRILARLRSTVAVAQLVERQVVVLDVAGSSPVGHPLSPAISTQGQGASRAICDLPLAPDYLLLLLHAHQTNYPLSRCRPRTRGEGGEVLRSRRRRRPRRSGQAIPGAGRGRTRLLRHHRQPRGPGDHGRRRADRRRGVLHAPHRRRRHPDAQRRHATDPGGRGEGVDQLVGGQEPAVVGRDQPQVRSVRDGSGARRQSRHELARASR
jgi:hypothetical protein